MLPRRAACCSLACRVITSARGDISRGLAMLAARFQNPSDDSQVQA